MSTRNPTAFNTGLKVQQQVGQIPRKVSAEQESHRLREAQDLLHHLQGLLMGGETPATDVLSNALQKAEGLISQIALSSDMDSQTRKTFEDINALLVAARQLGRNKLIADRLQKISEESQKALQEVRGPEVSAAAKEATQNLNDFINNWRPLFYLLMSSRDFRQLILDSIRVSKRVIYRYTDDISDETSKKFVEGAQAKDIAVTAKDMAKQKGVPELSEEEWNTLQDDVQQVLSKLAKEPTYRDGIERIFSLLDTFQRYITQIPVDDAAVVPENIHARRVLDETEDLVASFSGRDNFEQFKYHLRILILQTQKNEKLQSYLNELKVFILKAKSEEVVRTEEFAQQSRDLASRGREIMREWREQEDLNRFFDSGRDMIDNIKNDEFLQILRHHAGVVQSDLSFVDTQGNVQVDTDLLSKLQSALLPVLADALKYIPVPKIQSKENDQEFWLDNVVLCSYDILPENIRFHLEADSEISIRDIEMKSNRTFLVIQLNKLRTELKDIEFYYKKKTFPSFEDRGRVTFRIKGEGSRLAFTYKLQQEPQDTMPKIKEGNVSFDISNLDIEFDKTTLQHPVMIPMLTSLFKTQIKNQIEKQVENNLNGFIGKLGEMITSSLTVMNRPFMSGIERARKAVKSTPLAQVYEKRREIME